MSNTDHELKAYDQLCQSYRAIDDFRAKLLGFLPLATGAGIGVFLDKFPRFQDLHTETKGVLAAAGVFGALITLGLFSYEIYGIKKCGDLIMAGRRIEVLSEIDNGQFQNRPQSVAHVINEPFAAGIVYPAVLAAWSYFALAFAWPSGNPLIPLLVFTGGLVGTLIYDYILRREAEQKIKAAERKAHTTTVS
jgi:hypothetical protein